MALVQYIKRRTKKTALSFQDLNIIKEHVENIESFWEMGGQFNPVWKEKYDKTIKEIEYDTKKIGVMFATNYGEVIVIGYSLCHSSLDDFDYIDNNKYQAKGLGLQIAKERAYKWATYDKEKKGLKHFQVSKRVPDSIKPDLKKFIQRAQKYYKERTLSKWVSNFKDMNQPSEN